MSKDGTGAAGDQVKVLTVGPPCGRIADLQAKVSAINAKYGPFDVLFVLGDLFTPYVEGAELQEQEANLLKGITRFPIPIYFTLPPSPLHPNVRHALAAAGKLDVEAHDEEKDQEPIRLNDSLYFLRKQGVSLVPANPPISTSAEDAEARPRPQLRVAVAGGGWEAQHWHESLGKDEGAIEATLNPYMTAASVDRLVMHPAFHEPIRTACSNSGNNADNDDDAEEPPSTLAAARAVMARKAEAAQERAQQASRPSKPPVDILITNAWPNGVTMFSDVQKLPHPTSRVWGAPIVAQLARRAQPRYHFAIAPGSTGMPCSDDKNENAADFAFGVVGLDGTEQGKEIQRTGVFWEREPFCTDGVAPHPLCNVTRFVSLARFANEKKVRWFMALNLTTTAQQGKGGPSAAASKPPPNATPNPFSAPTSTGGGGKRKNVGGLDNFESGENFRWTQNKRQNKAAKHDAKGLPNRPNVRMPNRPGVALSAVAPKDCWFCLSNPQCAKHLIVAIGTECYIAMPKGQLPVTSSAADDEQHSLVPGGGHVLIVPIEHFPSLLGHTDPDATKSIAQEMQSWRLALSKAYDSFDAVMVAWEVCKTKGTRAGHMQAQAVPVPRAKASSSRLLDFFRQEAQKNRYTFVEDQDEVKSILTITSDAEERARRRDYVRLDLHNVTWIMWLGDEGMTRFNMQFPRQTLALFLDMPERADWKQCARSEAIETAETKAFKACFETYAEEVEGDEG